MIYKKALPILYFLLFALSVFSQNNPNTFKVENLDLRGDKPLFNHEGAIIGRLERIIDTAKLSGYLDIYGPLISKTKIVTFSGKEMILDLLPRKTIFIEKANRVITFGPTHSGCSVSLMVDIIVYNKLGEQIMHLNNIERFSLDISIDGTIYFADRNHLIKLNPDGSTWKKEIHGKLDLLNYPMVKQSFNQQEVAVIQNSDNYTTISVFDHEGTLIKSITPRNYGIKQLHFWNSKKLINFDNGLVCFQSIDFKSETTKENFHCFHELISPLGKGTFNFLGFYKTDYFALHLKEQNEIVILKFQNNEFSILKKFELGKDLLKKIKSTVFTKNKLELYTMKKKVTLMIN